MNWIVDNRSGVKYLIIPDCADPMDIHCILIQSYLDRIERSDLSDGVIIYGILGKYVNIDGVGMAREVIVPRANCIEFYSRYVDSARLSYRSRKNTKLDRYKISEENFENTLKLIKTKISSDMSRAINFAIAMSLTEGGLFSQDELISSKYNSMFDFINFTYCVDYMVIIRIEAKKIEGKSNVYDVRMLFNNRLERDSRVKIVYGLHIDVSEIIPKFSSPLKYWESQSI